MLKNRKSSLNPSRKPAPTLKLSEYSSRRSDAIQNGQAFGALLGESAAQILLNEFSNRNQPTSPASESWFRAWERLHSALNARANEPAVAAALKGLDDAYGNALVEMEDRTWHAAWGAVVGIFRGGSR